MANKLYKQSQDTKDTNVLISGPPAALLTMKNTHMKKLTCQLVKDEYVSMKKEKY